jgi:hypothetical protein
VGPRAVLDAVVKRKIPSPRRESNPRTPIVQPVAQCYTDLAITALLTCIILLNINFCLITSTIQSRSSSASIMTRRRDGQPGFDSRQGQGIFLFSTASKLALGSTQPLIQWVSRALSPGVERPGSEADHSPPSGVEVKNT